MIETLRDSNPNVWQLTKTRHKFEADNTAWKAKFATATGLLSELQKVGPLRRYLAENVADGIMALNTDVLAHQQRQPAIARSDATVTPRPPLRQANTNTTPLVPGSGVPGKKRTAETADVVGHDDKRSRSANFVMVPGHTGPVEVIDLT
jgi:hypothetical protein